MLHQRSHGVAVCLPPRPKAGEGRHGRTVRYASVTEALPAPPPGEGWEYAWAWADEAAGAAALVLTGELGRGLEVRQGVGSRILTRVNGDGTVDIGGRVDRT